ncbi:MAG: preprotein translocase subunit YajC [Parachlamydiales bacterium]|nr:preprotein translocase subunit YajC [Verrucomicrobiota bacterium]MBX3719891.1 preprotein translocase subunit YajC [Candidatus Acheromyda pituitae]
MKKVYGFLFGAAALLSSLPVFADGEAAPAAKENNLMQTLIMIAVALVFFYFILWRPEQKRRKQMENLRTSLKKGDRITAMGIIGTVVKVQDNTVILAMYDGAKIEVLKAAITDVQAGTAEDRSDKATIEASESR